jgi:hypothetical protein
VAVHRSLAASQIALAVVNLTLTIALLVHTREVWTARS